MTDKVVKHWIQKLTQFHWSPELPEKYLVKHSSSGEMVGIGRVAMQYPGSFNLTWAYAKESVDNYAKHVMAVAFFTKAVAVNKHEIDGANLEEWLTVYTRTEYTDWYKSVYRRLPDNVKALHNSALGIYEKGYKHDDDCRTVVRPETRKA